jgi:hypothetical protein
MRAAESARALGKGTEQARLLKVAMAASGAIAKLYGILPSSADEGEERLDVALEIIEKVCARARKGDGAE